MPRSIRPWPAPWACGATLVHYLLMAMVALVAVAAFQAVGSVLVVAMLIVPAATAHLLTDRLDRMVGIAVLVGVISAVAGYFGDAWLDATVSGMMALAAGAQFALAVLFAPRARARGPGAGHVRPHAANRGRGRHRHALSCGGAGRRPSDAARPGAGGRVPSGRRRAEAAWLATRR